jgi:hypothetical protein
MNTNEVRRITRPKVTTWSNLDPTIRSMAHMCVLCADDLRSGRLTYEGLWGDVMAAKMRLKAYDEAHHA